MRDAWVEVCGCVSEGECVQVGGCVLDSRLSRRKKLSKFSQNPDWKKHASNYVAKRYFKEEERETYFADTKLQMEAKLYGEEYNKMNPPKKV